MNKNTVEEYKMKIKAKYSEAKTGSFSAFVSRIKNFMSIVV